MISAAIAKTGPGLLVALIVLMFASPELSAQTAACRLVQSNIQPVQQVLRCPGLVIEVERNARYRLLDRNRDGTPDAADLRGGALLIQYDAGGRPEGFQILTPHAIASVRGTTWVVDVTRPQTSVFVVQGRVSVARSGQRRAVALSGGDGVDVTAGTGPLEVKRWGAQRVRALLARFGR